jgi:hypothetical protein
MSDTAAASNAQGNMNNVTTGGACLVDWELYGTRITPDDLRAALSAHGYDPSIVPDIDQDQRVRSAGAKFTQGRGGADRYRAEVTEDDLCVYVQILRRGDEGTVGGKAARRKFVAVASLVWDKDAQGWSPDLFWQNGQRVQQPADDSVRAAVNACRKQCDTARLHHDHEFIRPVLIQRPLRTMAAVPFIRRSGGCMVVPMQHWNDVQQLAGLVNSIGDSYLGVVKADITDKGTVKAMQRSVADTLTGEIAAVRSDLDEWRQRGKRLKSGAIGERMSQFQSIRDRAQLYADALGMAMKDLLSDVADAEADARDLLAMALGRKKPEPKPEPAAEAADAGAVTTEPAAEAEPTVAEVKAKLYTPEDLAEIGSIDLGAIARALGVADERVRMMRRKDKVEAILAAQA